MPLDACTAEVPLFNLPGDVILESSLVEDSIFRINVVSPCIIFRSEVNTRKLLHLVVK
ncbi:hypothetical protein FCV25MIE_22027 [Fagus crenata]